MTDTTWGTQPANSSYDDPSNWSLSHEPTGDDIAFFGTSTQPSLTISSGGRVGGWTFNPWADAYTVTISATEIDFIGAGIAVNGGSVTIVNGYVLHFFN